MTNETKTTKRKPTHAIFQVLGEGEKSRWIRVGSAWENRDSKGLHLRFDSFPLSGRIMVREITDKEDLADNRGAQ